MPSITVSNMSVAYHKGRTKALSDFSLTVSEGEFCVFLGPSGCGKTTALHCIAGLIKPDTGEVKIGDRVVTSAEKAVFLRPQERNIAMVFQEYALYPNMTVRGNLSFAMETMGKPKEEIRSKVQQTAEMLGIDGLLDRRPAQLSGGQRQRVALGRALVRDPQVFLLDEPLGNLDAKLRDQVRFEIKRLQRSLGVTTIYVTHDQTEAMTLADRIVLMKDGEVMQEGSPEDLYSRPKNLFVASFVGTPQINLLDCTVKQRPEGLVFEAAAFDLPMPERMAGNSKGLSGGKAVVGIRPSDFRLAADSEPSVVEGKVEVIEPLGDAILVHLAVGSTVIRAKLAELIGRKLDPCVRLSVDPDKLHVFDPQSGERVE